MGDTFDTEPLSDIYISMDIEQVSGTNQAEYGVTLRETDDGNYYYFAVTENWQEYSFGKWFNDQWVDIIDWTRTTAIRKDSPNRLAVLAEGSQFTLFINDQSVAQVTDTSIDQGIPGYIVGIWQANVDATFELDNIEVRAP